VVYDPAKHPEQSVATLLTHYQATECSITQVPSLSLHIDHDAELIVTHCATTNAPALYVCFLLKGSAPTAPSAIDKLLHSAQISSPSMLPETPEPLILCLNDYVPPSPDVPYSEYKGKDPVTNLPYTFLVIETVIHIASSLKGDGGQPLRHRDAWLSLNSLVKSKEGFVIDPNKATVKSKEGFVIDPNKATVQSADVESNKATKEGFVQVDKNDASKGFAFTNNDTNNIMQCDVLPYDADDTTPVDRMNYSVDSFSQQYATSMMFYIILVLVGLVSFFGFPMIYLYFYTQVNNQGSNKIPFFRDIHESFFKKYYLTGMYTWFDFIATVLSVVAVITLLSIGFSLSNGALILSGCAILVSYVISVVGVKYIFAMQKPVAAVVDSMSGPGLGPVPGPVPGPSSGPGSGPRSGPGSGPRSESSSSSSSIFGSRSNSSSSSGSNSNSGSNSGSSISSKSIFSRSHKK
jgi:uncharacterized membrane protein YgcG